MDKDYHIYDIDQKDTFFGPIIQISVSPYENTPIGYFYVDNKPETFCLPCTKQVVEVLTEAEELGAIRMNPDNFYYDKDFGFIHKSLYSDYLAEKNKQEGKETSKDFMSNEFDPDELGFLYLGFMNGRFTHPEKGKMFYKKHSCDNGCTLFIDKQFLDSLKGEFSNYLNNVHPSKRLLTERVLTLLFETQPAIVEELSSAYDYSTML